MSDKEKDKDRFSRRDFLKTAGLGAAGIGLAGLTSGLTFRSDKPFSFFNSTSDNANFEIQPDGGFKPNITDDSEPKTGSSSAIAGGKMYHATVYKEGGDVVAEQQDGTEIDRQPSGNAGTVINKAYQHVVDNSWSGMVHLAAGQYLVNETIVLDGRGAQAGGYGLIGADESFRNGMSTRLRANGVSGSMISVEQNYNNLRGMRLWGKNTDGNKTTANLVKTDGSQTSYFSHLRFMDTLGNGFHGTDIADSLMEKCLFGDCGSASNDTYCMRLGQSDRQGGLRTNWVKMVNTFGGSGDNTDAATCVSVENGSNLEAYYCKYKTHGASGQHTVKIGSSSGLLGYDTRFTSTKNTVADALYTQGRVELIGGNADSCRYGVHLDGANGSRIIGMDFRDSHSKAINCKATDCEFIGIDEQGGTDVGIHLHGNYNWVIGSYLGKQAGAGKADVAVKGSDSTNHIIGSQLVGDKVSFEGTATLQNTELRNGTQNLGAGYSKNGVATENLGDPSSTPSASYPEGTVVRNSNSNNNDTYRLVDGTWVQIA